MEAWKKWVDEAKVDEWIKVWMDGWRDSESMDEWSDGVMNGWKPSCLNIEFPVHLSDLLSSSGLLRCQPVLQGEQEEEQEAV